MTLKSESNWSLFDFFTRNESENDPAKITCSIKVYFQHCFSLQEVSYSLCQSSGGELLIA